MLSITFGVLAVFCLAYFGILVVYSGIHTSLIWIWPLMALLFVLLGRGWVLYCRHKKQVPLWVPVSAITLFAAGVTIFVILQVLIFSGLTQQEPVYLDYLIVLGTKVREDDISLTLKQRLDRTIRFLQEHPETTVVLSGGQGKDEPTSEAMAMAEYLRYNGIEPERMLLEINSTNTSENMIYSKALIEAERQKEKQEAQERQNWISRQRMELDRFLMETEELWEDSRGMEDPDRRFAGEPVPSRGPGSRELLRIPSAPKETELVPDKPLQIGVLTSNYHLFRAMQIGKKNGFISLAGVAASSDPVLFIHQCVRESLAILKDKFMGNM